MSTTPGPVRARHGSVVARVSPEDLVLVPHESRWEKVDGLALAALLALLGGLYLAQRSPGTAVVGRVLVVVGAVLIGLVLLGILLVLVLAVGTVLTSAVRGLSDSGRERLRQEAADRRLDHERRLGPMQLQRRHLTAVGPVEVGRRARLRLVSTEHGEVELTAARRHRERLDAIAAALTSS